MAEWIRLACSGRSQRSDTTPPTSTGVVQSVFGGARTSNTPLLNTQSSLSPNLSKHRRPTRNESATSGLSLVILLADEGSMQSPSGESSTASSRDKPLLQTFAYLHGQSQSAHRTPTSTSRIRLHSACHLRLPWWISTRLIIWLWQSTKEAQLWNYDQEIW